MALREEFEKTGNWLFKRRSFLPLFILPLLLITLRQSGYLERAFGSLVEYFWEGFCVILSFLGLVIRCIVAGYVPKGTSGRKTNWQQAEELNTTGMYSILRHPLYLGNFLIALAVALFTQALWLVPLCVCIFWFYYERIMFAEEEFLRNKFGKVYLEWAEKTPTFLPKFKNWQAPSLPFSFKNVFRREHSTFIAIIAIFTFLEISGNIVVEHKLDLDAFVWLIIFAISLVVYFVLRTLKKKTKILNVEGR